MYKLFTSFVFIITLSLILSDKSYALSSADPCADVSIIFARGSGAKLLSNEQTTFNKQITIRLGSKIKIHTYELGAETYGGAKYPATSVLDAAGSYIITQLTSADRFNAYERSVGLGKTELESYVAARIAKCPKERIVLGGYSQGAQVVGESRLSQYADKIDFIALFGDPRLYLPEGEGIYPDACRGMNPSIYRRKIGDCHTDNGSLGARKPMYMPASLKEKTGLWCNAIDYICGTSKLPYDMAGHSKYANSGGAIDRAAKEIAERLQISIKRDEESRGVGNGPSTNIDTSYHSDQGTAGKDVIFLVDTYHTMASRLPAIKEQVVKAARSIQAAGGKFTIASYSRYPMQTDEGQRTDTMLHYIDPDIDPDYAFNEAIIDAVLAVHENDFQVSPYQSMMDIADRFTWRDGATKSLLLFTDNSWNESQWMQQAAARHMLEIDPVNIYPVVPGDVADSFKELAEVTSGQVINDAGNVAMAVDKAVEKINTRPVVLLKNTEYVAEPGKEITFDASDSYVINSDITRYDWDFDGDSVFDLTTTDPVAKHIYATQGDGIMQVRATAANGTIANASATLKIGTYVPPARPHAPTNLTATVTSTAGSKSTVKLSWTAGDPNANKYSIRINDTPVGVTEIGRTMTSITDIDRTEEVNVSVAAVSNDGIEGEYATTTIPKVDLATQPNWLQALMDSILGIVQGVIPKFWW